MKLQIQSFLCMCVIKISSQVLNKTADAKYSQIHTNPASAKNVQLCIISQFIPPKHKKHNSHGLSRSSELICSSHTGTPTPNCSRRRLPNVTNIYPDKAHRRHSIALISPNRPTELYRPWAAHKTSHILQCAPFLVSTWLPLYIHSVSLQNEAIPVLNYWIHYILIF